jgi:serine/threonine protein kinase
MPSADWQKVREVFEAALDAAPENPEAWLEKQAIDSAIRREVASLLDHHSRAGAFMLESVVDGAPELLEQVLGDDAPLESGAVVGHYRIEREIGRGAMGRVYLATDTRLARPVALKALAPHLTGDASHRERLRREARAAASLPHPGICRVYALEEIDGQLFIASELVDGHTLRDEMSRGERPTAEAISTAARELAEALASAHSNGITHRDFKPENVMRHSDGRLKVLDFGLARIHEPQADDAAARATVAGALIGTPAYMSPEQLNGQPADARSDVFAYGVVMYEYASGMHPFHASTPLGLAARVLESEAEPIAVRSRQVPPTVAAVVDRCLQKTPAARFPSARDIVDALGRDGTHAQPAFVRWWRVHQLATMVLYLSVGWVSWWIKELLKPNQLPLAVFVVVGIGGVLAGVMRGHLVFTSLMNPPHLLNERRRLRFALVAVDLIISAGGAIAGLTLVGSQPLNGVLTVGLSLALGLATIMMEPATTRAAFNEA